MGDAGEGNPGRGLEVGQARCLLAAGRRPEWLECSQQEEEWGEMKMDR